MSHALIKASLAAPVLSEEVLRRPPKVVERSGRRAVEVLARGRNAGVADALHSGSPALAHDGRRAAGPPCCQGR